MGIFDNIAKRFLQPYINEAVKDASTLSKADGGKPAVTDVPLGMTMGYPFSGYPNRKDSISVTFETLRVFSVNYDVVRACINHRKRQIQNLEWAIVPKDEKVDPKKMKREIEKITAFFEEPAYMNDFTTFIDRIIEDMLIYDAIVLWKDRVFSGELKELLPVDAATIRIRVTSDGSLPEAPEPAYQQIIKGHLHAEYDTDQMLYAIMNPRNSTPYGLSPLESIVLGVDAALKSQMYNSNMLSEGSIPEGFFALPQNWTPDQIKDYQQWFDALMAGNTRFNTRIKFVPGGTGVGYTPTKKPEDMRMMEFEKWLLLKTCALFDVQPQDIGFLENVNYSTSQTQQQTGNQRGLIPTANFLKNIFTKIIKNDFKNNDLKFEWKGLQVIDDKFELEKDTKLIALGAYTIDEMRVKQGLKPFNLPYTQKPWVFANGIPVLLDEIDEVPEVDPNTPSNDTAPDKKPDTTETEDPEEEDDEAKIEEMEKWETKCINSLKKGKGIPTFTTNVLDDAVYKLISTQLMVAKRKEDVKEIFWAFKDAFRKQVLINKAIGLKDDIAKYQNEHTV